MSGAATGGILAARAGMKAAGKSALAGGVILAAIEGLNIVVVSAVWNIVVHDVFLPSCFPQYGNISALLPSYLRFETCFM